MGLGSSIACDISLNSSLTPEQRERYQNTRVIRDILSSTKTIAVVGLSSEAQKASNMVASYLQDEGFRIVPVNPNAAEILGEKSYPDLASIPYPIDLVDIFRPVAEVPALVEQAIALHAKAVWMQLRIINFPAADRALAAGLSVVIDRCIKMEHGRFSGSLHWAGINTEIVTARRGGL
jgi:predicted CoA-binding protein